MPKVGCSFTTKLKSWIEPFNNAGGDTVFSTDGKVIVCNICSKHIPCERKFQISQHVNTGVHQAGKARHAKKMQQQLLTTAPSTSKDNFNDELCYAMVASGIPLWNLTKGPFKNFLIKYIDRHIPDESTLRKSYLKICYQNVIEQVKFNIGDSYLYLVVDETTDRRGLYVANLLVGVLNQTEPKKPFLIACKQLEQTNHETICRFINNGLKILSKDTEIENRVLLLIMDAASYMVKAAGALKNFYCNMVHVTCVAHGCSRIAEKVRTLFSEVNKLINNGKKMFLKAPSRITKYKNIMAGKQLPPQPVITRWGTWLEAAVFYAKNLDQFRIVVNEIFESDEDRAQSVLNVHTIINSGVLSNHLAFINAHLSFLVTTLEKLQNTKLSLDDSFKLIYDLKDKKNLIPGNIGKSLKEKMEDVMSKNSGLTTLEKVNKILNGDDTIILETFSPMILSAYKYAPLTSVDVERSFSTYKCILNDRRLSFNELNMEMCVVIHFNAENL